jgi:CRISPR-associated protein Cmr3
MSVWIVDPIDPLVFGDGRPFSAIPGGVLRSRPLPPPTALAGVVRAQLGKSTGRFDATQIPALLQISVRGPLVALLNAKGEVDEWLAPRPLDAVVQPKITPKITTDGVDLCCLRPTAWPAGSLGSQKDSLAPLDCGRSLRKPPRELRPFWRLKTELIPWLEDPTTLQFSEDLGVDGPTPDRRVHVAINPKTGTALHGALFSVEGRAWIIKHGEGTRRLAFAVDVAGHSAPKETLHPLGGERRLASWRAHGVKHQDTDWPELPASLLQAILKKHPPSAVGGAQTRGLRVLLATPAAFDEGALPRDRSFGLRGAKLVAVANDRAEVISGWDLHQGAPKETRRLVPAGAVYYLDTVDVDDQILTAWLKAKWLCSVSEAPQAQRDGLGLALFGAWDGALQTF